MFLNPAKNSGDTFKERGYWSAYDPSTNKVYFAAPGGSTETPQFQIAYYALDLNSGLTSSYLNIDDSVNLFFGNTNSDSGQKVVAFSVPEPASFALVNSGAISVLQACRITPKSIG